MSSRLCAVLVPVVATLVASLAVAVPAVAAPTPAAPTAGSALPPPTVTPASVTTGSTTVVAGTQCFGDGGSGSQVTAWLTQATGATVGAVPTGTSSSDGTWSLQLTVPLDTVGGQSLEVRSSCGYRDLGTYRRYPVQRLDVYASGVGSWSASIVPLPDVPNGRLTAVSCASARACVAVGTARRAAVDVPLLEVFDGSGWSLVPQPDLDANRGATLSAVSCPSTSRCVAVGRVVTTDGVRPLVATRNADSWQLTVLPLPDWRIDARDADFGGVSCPAVARCVAVGRVGDLTSSVPSSVPTASVLRGNVWTTTAPTTGGSSETASVSCRSTTLCAAVWSAELGSAPAPVQRFDGRRWTAAPALDASVRPTAVSCAASGPCVAVGLVTDGRVDTPLQPWAAGLDDTGWTPFDLGDVGTGALTAVNCADPTTCVAVGRRGSRLAPGASFSLRRTDSTWTAADAPAGVTLAGVACPSAGGCTAVGTAAGTPAVVRGTGTSWSVVAVPAPSGLPDAGFAAVSCGGEVTGTACVTVGRYVDAGGVGRPLVDRWTSSTGWNLQTFDIPAGRLTGVSCPSTTSCTAVGRVEVGTDPAQRLVLQWTSTTGWQRVTTGAATGVGYLAAVSCGTVGTCLAVGTDNAYAPLVLSLRNGRWVKTAAPPTGGPTRVTMPSVSCVGTTCRTAVSSRFGDAPYVETGLTWTPSGWRADPSRSGVVAGPVTCLDVDHCLQILLGGTAAVAVDIDGTNRTVGELPVEANFGATPTATSCHDGSGCVVVGGSDLGPAAARRTADRWQVEDVPTPGVRIGTLQGVSCLYPGRCMAVGGGDGDQDGPPVVVVDAPR